MPQFYELEVKSWRLNCRAADTWNSELIMMVSEKIDNGNTLISDDMITWILDTQGGAIGREDNYTAQ